MTEPLLYVALGDHHQPSGRTTHTVIVDGKRTVMPPPAALRIVRWEDEVILQYLNAAGTVQTHVHQSTVGEAIEQAELEFGIAPGEWRQVDVKADGEAR